jgi:hypothetical protein
MDILSVSLVVSLLCFKESPISYSAETDRNICLPGPGPR